MKQKKKAVRSADTMSVGEHYLAEYQLNQSVKELIDANNVYTKALIRYVDSALALKAYRVVVPLPTKRKPKKLREVGK